MSMKHVPPISRREWLNQVRISQIAAGQQGEKLHVFLFKKSEFDLYKKFTLNFGPINGQEKAVFELPR